MKACLLGLMCMAWLLSSACTSAQGPIGVLDEYREALKKRDFGKAYGMMSQRFRARHSRADFIRTMKASPHEVQHTVAQLKRIERTAQIHARLDYGLSESLALIWRDGTWQIATDPTAYYSQSTPRDALRSFLRAYELKRWDVMLRFVPSEYRKRMDVAALRKQFEGPNREDVVGMMAALAASLDRPIEDRGDEARMTYGDRSEVQFLFEDSSWKIRDLK